MKHDTVALQLVPLSLVDPVAVEHLLDLAFGSDRFTRTAYRLRQNTQPIAALSHAILDGPDLLASIQCWPVGIAEHKLVLVGPVAVHPDHQNKGLGRWLMHHMLEIAAELGEPPMVMIGDPEYYGRFGFTADATGSWSLPGPWEPHRLLARNSMRLPATGMIEEDRNAI